MYTTLYFISIAALHLHHLSLLERFQLRQQTQKATVRKPQKGVLATCYQNCPFLCMGQSLYHQNSLVTLELPPGCPTMTLSIGVVSGICASQRQKFLADLDQNDHELAMVVTCGTQTSQLVDGSIHFVLIAPQEILRWSCSLAQQKPNPDSP